MKQAAVRFLIYLVLLSIVFAVFGAPTPGPISSQLARAAEHGAFAFLVSSAHGLVFQLVYYGVAIGFWLIVFELIFRIVSRERRRRERVSANEWQIKQKPGL